MKLKKIAIASMIGLGFLTSSVMAQQITGDQLKKIEKNLGSVNAEVKVQSVNKTPWDNVYEVVLIGNQILYSNADASLVMAVTPGSDRSPELSIIDVAGKKNLSDAKREELNRVDYAKLPFKNSFTYQKGKGTNEVAIFVDPNCTFCKKFEQTLDSLDDVKAHIFLYPVLGTDSMDKATHVWCSKDNKTKIWRDWMLNNKAIPKEVCGDTAVLDNLTLGRKLGITGTPTLIFKDGSRIPGAASAADLMKKFHEIKTKK